MSTYKTKNPLGSAAVKDLYDNAENVDKFVNDRTKEELEDRLGVLRKTWHGMEMIFSRFIDYITGRGEQAVAAIGWQELGNWAVGLAVDNRQQIVYYNGSWYKYLGELEHVIDGDSPENDGGVWSAANPTGKWSNIGDAALRSNLGSSEEGLGISLNALEQGGNGQHLAVFVSPQMRHSDPHSFFGAATMNAFMTAMDMGIGEVRIPAGEYILESTVSVTLTMHMSLTFDPGVIIYVDSPKDVFAIDINGFNLDIRAANGRIMSRWGSADGSSVAAFRITDASLDKSVSTDSLKVGSADGTSRFGYAVWASGINLATFYRCLLQGIRGIYLESPLISGATAHAMGAQIFGCEIYTTNECVKIANQGALGAEGIGVWGCEFVTGGIAIIIDNVGLSSSAYLPPLTRINNNHFNCYQALYARDISRLHFGGNDVQGTYSADKPINGWLELGGVQQFLHASNSYSAAATGSGTTGDNCPSVIHQFASTLSNAFFTSNGNVYQLDAMTRPAFSFSGTANITEIQVSNDRLNSSGTWVDSAWLAYVRLSPEMTIGNLGAAGGLDYSTKGSFSAGVLSLGARPSQGFTYSIPVSIVPNSSGISQITFPSQMVGKEVNILLAAANVSFTHGTNMVCPDQKSFVMTLPNVIKVFALNTTQCIILDVGGMANRHTDITSIPTSRTSPGYPGAEVFDSANMILYRYIAEYGWGEFEIKAFS